MGRICRAHLRADGGLKANQTAPRQRHRTPMRGGRSCRVLGCACHVPVHSCRRDQAHTVRRRQSARAHVQPAGRARGVQNGGARLAVYAPSSSSSARDTDASAFRARASDALRITGARRGSPGGRCAISPAAMAIWSRETPKCSASRHIVANCIPRRREASIRARPGWSIPIARASSRCVTPARSRNSRMTAPSGRPGDFGMTDG